MGHGCFALGRHRRRCYPGEFVALTTFTRNSSKIPSEAQPLPERKLKGTAAMHPLSPRIVDFTFPLCYFLTMNVPALMATYQLRQREYLLRITRAMTSRLDLPSLLR